MVSSLKLIHGVETFKSVTIVLIQQRLPASYTGPQMWAPTFSIYVSKPSHVSSRFPLILYHTAYPVSFIFIFPSSTLIKKPTIKLCNPPDKLALFPLTLPHTRSPYYLYSFTYRERHFSSNGIILALVSSSYPMHIDLLLRSSHAVSETSSVSATSV